MQRQRMRLLTVLLGLVMRGLFSMATLAQEPPRISKEELKALLGKLDVVIIDVRIASDWTDSDQKIAGAVREEPADVKSWTDKYRKDMTTVLYCA